MAESGVRGSEGMLTFGSMERLDAELSRVARGAEVLRLGLADGLEALARLDGHHEMGFATVEAYALERCERSARWVQESRWLSRRLSELPAVRAALARGEVSFSMAQVIAKVASREDEESWLSEARQRTVREMRCLVEERSEGGSQMSSVPREEEEEKGTLTLTMDREDAWLFECARMLVERVAGGPLEPALSRCRACRSICPIAHFVGSLLQWNARSAVHRTATLACGGG